MENYSDIWIVCDNKSRVFHFGGNKLQYYIPKLKKGRNIVNDIQAINNDLIFDIEESDGEVLFKFKAANMETIAKYIKPKIYRAKKGGSPFSVDYLPKNKKKKYDISHEDLTLYKEFTASIAKGSVNVYTKINNGFIAELATKKHGVEAIKEEFENSKLSYKEYFYSIGLWDKYLNYIKNYLNNI